VVALEWLDAVSQSKASQQASENHHLT